jgi:hypothetical protein
MLRNWLPPFEVQAQEDIHFSKQYLNTALRYFPSFFFSIFVTKPQMSEVKYKKLQNRK